MKIIRFLKQSPDYQLHLAGKRAARSLNQELTPFDLTMTQSLILVALYFEKDRHASFEGLAQALEMTKGGLSQHLSELEARGWVKRISQKSDRRSSQVSLKAAGEALCVYLIRIFDGHQRKLEVQFGEKKLKKFLLTLNELSPLNESLNA